jgi:hypothetical protein
MYGRRVEAACRAGAPRDALQEFGVVQTPYGEEVVRRMTCRRQDFRSTQAEHIAAVRLERRAAPNADDDEIVASSQEQSPVSIGGLVRRAEQVDAAVVLKDEARNGIQPDGHLLSEGLRGGETRLLDQELAGEGRDALPLWRRNLDRDLFDHGDRLAGLELLPVRQGARLRGCGRRLDAWDFNHVRRSQAVVDPGAVEGLLCFQLSDQVLDLCPVLAHDLGRPLLRLGDQVAHRLVDHVRGVLAEEARRRDLAAEERMLLAIGQQPSAPPRGMIETLFG